MQDLRQGYYMAYELSHTRRGNKRRSFYAYQFRMSRYRSLVTTVAFLFVSQEVASLPPRLFGISAKKQYLKVSTYSAIVTIIAGHLG